MKEIEIPVAAQIGFPPPNVCAHVVFSSSSNSTVACKNYCFFFVFTVLRIIDFIRNRENSYGKNSPICYY